MFKISTLVLASVVLAVSLTGIWSAFAGYSGGGTGSGSSGTVAIDQTTPGTTNGVSLTTLLACEDQTNHLCMASGGAARMTQIVGTGNIPSTATDATGTAVALMVGKKTFLAVETCTGTCTQTIKIYGAFENSATVAKSVLLCTLILSASTTASDFCTTDLTFMYYFPVTSGTGGTTPLSGVFAMY